ncbi:phosphoethanolamine N-methyltransferase-like [Lingula anatina]|uniref:phosphoethanolamine N-methyltransferase n=1 Tax=Lingula anatina TaxID=7574 RepID=A0A1S3HYT1_LINAN|nr:phosphoethanolamine N-methyltransferase-like [Lingula anatina]|eukprot:XP_013391180.1 phosphoethanolamine N-methyltransferase-like [Lingula anatina]
MAADETRHDMTQFWESHSKDATLQEMMLDSNAELLCKEEIPEILELIPSLEGKTVLELGSGIGRFTSVLADKAKQVTAVDFMQKFVDKNKELNGHRGNVEFLCADVTKLDLPEGKYDLVFSNWLFMYLGDEEVRAVAEKILSWLKDGCYFFFRESCFHQSGDKKREANPTKYRDPATYSNLFKSVSVPVPDGTNLFEVILSKSIQTYVKLKDNSNQVCWLMHKMHSNTAAAFGHKTFQDFLDNQQYSRNGILRYEMIFGRHFVSTGGLETTEEFVKMLDLKPGQRVLDVGAGIGGSAFHMAEKYGAHVLAVDLSENMIGIGLERANEIRDKRVQFEVADATKREYPPESFDVVYSRDTILHIADKETLFRRLLSFLKPGGKLLISDYCCSDGDHSENFQKYVAQRGYHLLTPTEYGKLLEKVGFVNVRAEDRTDHFIDVLQRELKRTESIKDDFIKKFSEEDYNYIVEGWKVKIARCSGTGEQRWGLFYAEKPQ